MDKLIKQIIEEFNLPRPITKKEAIGKTVKEITFGTWCEESTYVIFEDNTVISFRERWFGDSHEDYVLEPDDYDSAYITDLGYGEKSKYHQAYLAFNNLSREEHHRREEEREREQYKKLKEKFGEN